jgi:signal transduction histidine kinase/CheY-like chemotaxis protein
MMKKYTLYFILPTVLVIVLNIYFYFSIFQNQVSFQRGILAGQAEASATEIENSILDFENDVNALLFSNVLLNINLKSDDFNQDGLRNLEILLSNNSELIKNVHIYDFNKNVLNLSFNKGKKLLIDPFVTQRNEELLSMESISKMNNYYNFSFPVFKDSILVSNIVFTLDLNNFFKDKLSHYFHDEAFCQWVVDRNGQIKFLNAPSILQFSDSLLLQNYIRTDQPGFLKHKVLVNHNTEEWYSAVAPFSILHDQFAVGFSMQKSFVFNLILSKVILSCVFSTLIMLLFLIYIVSRMGKNLSLKEKSVVEMSSIQAVFDNLPVGITVMDQNHHTKIVNKTAREMLLVNQEEVGDENITDRLMFSKDYYDLKDDSSFDTHQFVLYKHEGEEVAVYKKDLPLVIEDEEYLLSAYVDVTPIEKARKYEAASNTAKSEFLAKMSHEIRTPMNGIIGMTEALGQENLTPNQREYVQIVKRSADVLLTLIDDILDFSKIEAGKMQLEEIPFKLREEVKLCVDLFRPIIAEKKLQFSLKINPDVPENIIGDPFRLRQVLSNLLSNAIKFTHEGEIGVGIELEEEYNNNVSLLFYVEDTGVGIARNKIESIFNSFTQAEESTSRKYGGTGLGTTIAKQLVTLMHGEIWVQSPSPISTKPNYPGSRFSFTIEVYSNERIIKPLQTEKVQHLSDLKAIIVGTPSQSKQHLIRLFELEKIYFESIDYVQDKFAELQQKLNEYVNSYQLLIIMDEVKLNGLQLAKRLKDSKIIDHYVTILISSNHRPENFIQSRRFAVDYYFAEPFEQTDLMQSFYNSFPNVEKSATDIVRKIKSDLSILVAEDNEINIRVAQTIFANLGYKIDIARNGAESIQKVKTTAYDVVFMDLVMPEKDGIQATVEIRSQGFKMPIVAMTATSSIKSKNKAISSGMNDYIVKPVKAESIRSVLIKWFA